MNKNCAKCDHRGICAEYPVRARVIPVDHVCSHWSGWHDVATDPPKEEFKKDYLVLEEDGEGVQHYGISMFYGFGQMCQGFYEYPDGVWEGDAYGFKVIAWRELSEYEVEK